MASLHAKVYLFGNHIVIGSGNLTANGLALHGTGNLELNTIIRATPEATDLLNGIFDQAQAFDIDLLDRMEAYLDSQPQNKNYMGWWPKNVVPPVIRSLYCNDLPVQDHFSLSKYENEPWNSIQQQISERRFENARDLLTSSFAYRWLKTKLLENENELYFGKISSQLHNELADDPAPYRADVKSLLANLLAVINEIPECEIVVDRPRHSQRVRLSNKN